MLATPPTPPEPISDKTLLRYAKGEPSWARGVISEGMQAELVMALPDIVGQLMAHRLSARLRALPFPKPRNHGEEIANIRATDGRPDCPYNGQGVA